MSERELEELVDVEHQADEQVTDPETGDVDEQTGDVTDPAGEAELERQATELDEQPPAPEISERELVRRFRDAERRGEKWVEFVTAFAEETGQPLVRCAVCLEQAPGFHFHPDAVPLSDEQIAAARLLAGLPLEPTFEQDPASAECLTCRGWGRVKTGSKVAGYNVVDCPDCLGTGYKTSRPAGELRPAGASTNGETADSVLSEQERAGDDAWGTPRSHPDWGKAPQYRSPNWQAELAAYRAGLPAPIAPAAAEGV